MSLQRPGRAHSAAARLHRNDDGAGSEKTLLKKGFTKESDGLTMVQD